MAQLTTSSDKELRIGREEHVSCINGVSEVNPPRGADVVFRNDSVYRVDGLNRSRIARENEGARADLLLIDVGNGDDLIDIDDRDDLINIVGSSEYRCCEKYGVVYEIY